MNAWKRLAAAAALVAIVTAPLGAQVGKSVTIVDPNVAGEKELAALPHMNGALVKGILAQRPFLSMTDLHALLSKTLKPEQLEELYGRMFVHVNLNTASKEAILLIPGVGNRMLREFKEYRPYKSIEQFRREIGKYVDEKEVARLERYVSITP